MINEWLVLIACLCLISALIEAWFLVVLFSNPQNKLASIFKNPQDLLKSHIDYIMMSLLLFVFYLLFAYFAIQLNSFIIISLILGAIGNPLLFAIRAIYPELKQQPTTNFKIMMTLSCILTTVGFVSSAGILALNVLNKIF